MSFIDAGQGKKQFESINPITNRALSIRQPWAWLTAWGYKDIENRTWRTNFRGDFLIHAGLKTDQDGFDFATEMGIILPPDLPHGGIVGRAEITDCVSSHDSPCFFGPWGFVVRNAEPLQFRTFTGRLGFFKTEPQGIMG